MLDVTQRVGRTDLAEGDRLRELRGHRGEADIERARGEEFGDPRWGMRSGRRPHHDRGTLVRQHDCPCPMEILGVDDEGRERRVAEEVLEGYQIGALGRWLRIEQLVEWPRFDRRGDERVARRGEPRNPRQLLALGVEP